MAGGKETAAWVTRECWRWVQVGALPKDKGHGLTEAIQSVLLSWALVWPASKSKLVTVIRE